MSSIPLLYRSSGFFLTLSAFLLSMSIASFCFHFFSGYGLGFPRLGGVGVGKGNA